METTIPTPTTGEHPATTHAGGCQCGAVRFEVDIAAGVTPTRCNCTICTKLAPTGSVVKPEAFRLLRGEESLTRYGKNPEVATRAFCSRCGVYCFGSGDLPQLGGAFVSVNWNTFDDVDLGTLAVLHWDGRHDNWMAGPRPTPWPIHAAPPAAAPAGASA